MFEYIIASFALIGGIMALFTCWEWFYEYEELTLFANFKILLLVMVLLINSVCTFSLALIF